MTGTNDGDNENTDKTGHCELKTAERRDNCLMIQVWAVLTSHSHSHQRAKKQTKYHPEIPKLKLLPFRHSATTFPLPRKEAA